VRDLPSVSEGESRQSATIVVTGASGPIGRRVCALLAAEPDVVRVVALDVVEPAGSLPDRVEHRRVDLSQDDLGTPFAAAGAVIHLASVFGPALDDDPVVAADGDVVLARRVLAAADDAGVDHLVMLSSATVYGAWPNNAVPLTEDAALRPDPGCAFAVQKAEAERLALEWADDHPGATVALLRAATTVAEDHPGWLAGALRAAAAVRGPQDDPPAQFLHTDDLASAVATAWRKRLAGPHNVAPDGWLRAAELAALSSTPRLRVPQPVVDRVARLRWRLRLARAPPGVQPYARHPWVVANDRLKAAGWRATSTNEEAFVAGTPAGPWATLSPRRRQELALGASAVVVGGAAAGAVTLLRRRARV
jgi:nucleoside-diphosphate-sugar epimerase